MLFVDPSTDPVQLGVCLSRALAETEASTVPCPEARSQTTRGAQACIKAPGLSCSASFHSKSLWQSVVYDLQPVHDFRGM